MHAKKGRGRQVMVTGNGYVTLYVAHYFVAIVERLFSIGSWDVFENEVNEKKSGSICIITICLGTKNVPMITRGFDCSYVETADAIFASCEL